MNTEIVEQTLARFKSMKAARATADSLWQEIAEMVHPRRADFTGARAFGGKRTERIFDGTPVLAMRQLAATIDGMIKPKTTDWFTIKSEDETLNADTDAKLWLEAVEKRMRAAIYAPAARFQQRSGEVDRDLIAFGNGVLLIEQNQRGDGLVFRACPLRDCYFAENADGDIDTVFRSLRLSAHAAVRMFGRGKVGRDVREAAEEGGDNAERPFEFLHAVMPRAVRDPSRRDNGNLPFASLVIEVATGEAVGTSGYHEFPYAVPRWETATDSVYAGGPAELALPDIKTLNAQNRTNLKTGQMQADPPILIPNKGVKATRLIPGRATVYDADLFGPTSQSPVRPVLTGANLPVSLGMENQRRDMVWAMFLRNVLNLPMDAPQMTATEVLQRKEEFLRVIGPTFGRLETDYVAPIVERAFGIMMRAGMLPPPPAVLAGRGVRFVYASPVAKAQKAIDLAAAARTVEAIAPFAANDPSVLDNFDVDRIARDSAEGFGMPQHWLRPADEVSAIRQARQQAADAAQAVDDAQKIAAAIPKVAPLLTGMRGHDFTGAGPGSPGFSNTTGDVVPPTAEGG